MPTPVNFTELTSEYIGILYEGLLDYELHRAGERAGRVPAPRRPARAPARPARAMPDKAARRARREGEGQRGKADGEDDDADEDDDDERRTPTTRRRDRDRGGRHPGRPSGRPNPRPDDDDHAQARARALAWSRKAVVVGRLVKKPVGRNADKNPEYLAEADGAAGQLIADLKLPGELYLVRWGGTRKGAGTFYTRPQLTQPTVRRTLEPLTHDETGAVRPRRCCSTSRSATPPWARAASWSPRCAC
jgi:hypothetical protein